MTQTNEQEVTRSKIVNLLLSDPEFQQSTERVQAMLADPSQIATLSTEEREALVQSSDPVFALKRILRTGDQSDAEKVELLLEALDQLQQASMAFNELVLRSAQTSDEIEQKRMNVTIAAFLIKAGGSVTLTHDDLTEAIESADRISSAPSADGETFTYRLVPVVPGADRVQ